MGELAPRMSTLAVRLSYAPGGVAQLILLAVREADVGARPACWADEGDAPSWTTHLRPRSMLRSLPPASSPLLRMPSLGFAALTKGSGRRNGTVHVQAEASAYGLQAGS